MANLVRVMVNVSTKNVSAKQVSQVHIANKVSALREVSLRPCAVGLVCVTSRLERVSANTLILVSLVKTPNAPETV